MTFKSHVFRIIIINNTLEFERIDRNSRSQTERETCKDNSSTSPIPSDRGRRWTDATDQFLVRADPRFDVFPKANWKNLSFASLLILISWKSDKPTSSLQGLKEVLFLFASRKTNLIVNTLYAQNHVYTDLLLLNPQLHTV